MKISGQAVHLWISLGLIYNPGGGLIIKSCSTLCDPMDCSPPGSSVHGTSQQEYWSGLPFLSPGDLPQPEIEPGSPASQVDFLPTEPTREVLLTLTLITFVCFLIPPLISKLRRVPCLRQEAVKGVTGKGALCPLRTQPTFSGPKMEPEGLQISRALQRTRVRGTPQTREQT